MKRFLFMLWLGEWYILLGLALCILDPIFTYMFIKERWFYDLPQETRKKFNAISESHTP